MSLKVLVIIKLLIIFICLTSGNCTAQNAAELTAVLKDDVINRYSASDFNKVFFDAIARTVQSEDLCWFGPPFICARRVRVAYETKQYFITYYTTHDHSPRKHLIVFDRNFEVNYHFEVDVFVHRRRQLIKACKKGLIRPTNEW